MTRMASRTGWTHAAIVAAMVYAFVLQMLLLPIGGALHAATLAGAQGILCIQDGSSSSDPSPAKAHDGLCCLAGCHGSGPAEPPGSTALERLEPLALVAETPDGSSVLRVTSSVLPLGSRAPPRLG